MTNGCVSCYRGEESRWGVREVGKEGTEWVSKEVADRECYSIKVTNSTINVLCQTFIIYSVFRYGSISIIGLFPHYPSPFNSSRHKNLSHLRMVPHRHEKHLFDHDRDDCCWLVYTPHIPGNYINVKATCSCAPHCICDGF